MISIEDLSKARQEALDEIIEGALEFGLDLTLANHIAPIILRYIEDSRGPQQAIIEDEPGIAERLGWIVKQ